MPRSGSRPLVIAAILLAGCTGSATPSITSTPPTSSGSAAPSALPTSSAVPTSPPSQRPLCDTAIVGEPDPGKLIDAEANIYAAGRDAPVAPGGLGGGKLPPTWPLPDGAVRVVTVTDVAGCVTPISGNSPFNGPAGDGFGPTLVEPFQGISGVTHQSNGMFLVGVFLTDAEPADPPPATLDVTDEETGTIEPEIGQVFFVGDGAGREFVAPAEATRLYLGFADAPAYRGLPGAYDNNAGQLQATVTITGD